MILTNDLCCELFSIEVNGYIVLLTRNLSIITDFKNILFLLSYDKSKMKIDDRNYEV